MSEIWRAYFREGLYLCVWGGGAYYRNFTVIACNKLIGPPHRGGIGQWAVSTDQYTDVLMNNYPHAHTEI